MELLKSLININSVSGNEQEIQTFIQKYLVQLGLKPIVMTGNTMVKISGQDTTKAIIFNVHVDTVGVGDLSLWDHNPFEGRVVGKKIYGLGASDEKASIAVLLEVAEILVNRKPACDVWLQFVNNEEVSGQGTKDCLEWFVENTSYTEVAGVLGEPTSLTRIEVAHRGNAFIKITTFGDSGHASDPHHSKKHAVLQMISFMQKVQTLSEWWKSEYKDLILGNPTVGLYTSISAGDCKVPNKFPSTCTTTLDVRTTPRLHSRVIKEIQSLEKDVRVEYIYPPLPCGYTSPNEKIVTLTQGITGVGLEMSMWSNDLCFFTEKNIPAVVYGPGDKKKIHDANEYCLLGNIEKCLKQYLEIIIEFGR